MAQPRWRLFGGFGCLTVLAVIVIVALIGWAVTLGLSGTQPFRQLQPIPEDVPPHAGEPVPEINVHGPGRTAEKLSFWSDGLAEDTGIPAPALRAYGNAELIAKENWPECHLRWNTLAGIGQVETRHGTYSGRFLSPSELDADGIATPQIIGPALDGADGFAAIPDTDAGELDGDEEWDHAVGPLQFIPESWQRYAIDADGDGVADPNQIDDAAATAAHLLCTGRDLSKPRDWVQAVNSYNMSEEYLINVRDAANSYALRQPATR